MSFFYESYLKKLKSDFKNSAEDLKDAIKSWPEKWKVIDYKEYKRFKQIPLQINKELFQNKPIADLLYKRNSDGRGFESLLGFEKLSNILYFAGGQKGGTERRFYPSAGSRYPLEVYVFVNKDIKGLSKGVYHYNIKENLLEYMWLNDSEGHVFIGFKEKNDSEMYIVVTSVIGRSSIKYGELAFKYSYIETGCLLQNILLLSTGLGISSSINNHNDFLFEKVLDIDGESEFVTGVVSLSFKEINYD